MPHYHRSWGVLVQLPFEPPAPLACVTELLLEGRLQCPRKAIKITGMLSWQRPQPWLEICCLECIFTLNFRPSPYQAPPSTRWITRHTKTESTSVSYLRIEQREQGMIRHGLRSPLENFRQKLVLKKKSIEVKLFITIFSWKIAHKRRKKTNCAIIGHLRLLGDWVGVVLNCTVGMFKKRLWAQFPTQPRKSQSNKLQGLPKQSHCAMRHNTHPVYRTT